MRIFCLITFLFFICHSAWSQVIVTPSPVDSSRGHATDSLQKAVNDNAHHKKTLIQLPQRKPITIGFDDTGRMIGFPRSIIRKNDKIVFAVRMSRRSFVTHLNNLLLRYAALYQFLVDSGNRRVFWTLFGDPGIVGLIASKDSKDIDIKIISKDPAYRFLLQLEGINGIKEEINIVYDLKSYIDTGKQTTLLSSLRSFQYIPLSLYIDNMVYHSYDVMVSTATNGEPRRFELRPDLRHSALEDSCYWWRSDTLDLKTLSGQNCDCSDSLKFTLTIQDPLKATVVTWYNAQVDSAVGSQADSIARNIFKEKLQSLESLIVQYRMAKHTADKKKTGDDNGKSDTAKQTAHQAKKVVVDPAQLLNAIFAQRDWLLHWLWYDSGRLVVNPLPVHEVQWVTDRNTALTALNDSLKNAQQDKKQLDTSIAQARPGLGGFDTLKKLQRLEDTVAWYTETLKHRIDSVTRLLAPNAAEAAAVVTNRQAYAASLYINGHERSPIPLPWQVQKQFSYYAGRKYIAPVARNSRDRERTTELPRNETAIVVIHNVPSNAKVKVDQTISAFDDLEEFTKQVQNLTKAIDSSGLLQAAQAPIIGNATKYIQEILRGSGGVNLTNATQANSGIAMKSENLTQNVIDPKTAAYLQTPNTKATLPLDTGSRATVDIKPVKDVSSGLVTNNTPMVSGATAPYSDNISIQIDSAKATGVLKVGNLYTFQLAAGFAITTRPAMQTAIDTTGNGFKTSNSSNNAETIIGVKFYPAKTYLRDGSIIPRYPLRRFSILLAVSVPHVLDNFYVGGAYDLVPGLTFTVGKNFYKQNYYEVQNARIINTETRYGSAGMFYGATVNPIVFVQFIKLFFK